MAEDITSDYKSAITNAMGIADTTYNNVRKSSTDNRYFVIDKRLKSKSGIVITMHANEIIPLGDHGVYDFSMSGPAVQITFDDDGKIADGSIIPSLTIGAVLSSGTTSPDDDFTVTRTTSTAFTAVLDDIRNFMLSLVK